MEAAGLPSPHDRERSRHGLLARLEPPHVHPRGELRHVERAGMDAGPHGAVGEASDSAAPAQSFPKPLSAGVEDRDGPEVVLPVGDRPVIAAVAVEAAGGEQAGQL